MITIRLNGRKHYYNRIEAFTKVAPGEYAVQRRSFPEPFKVWGGRKSGGSRTDWWLEHPTWAKPITCSSVVDALNLLEGM